MNPQNVKVGYRDFAAFLEANKDRLVKDILSRAYTFMTANTSAKDQAICDSGDNVIAILDSFTKRYIPVKGKLAVEIGKGNGSTGYATMSKLANAVYSRQLAKWHKETEERNSALEHNNSLTAKFLNGELKAEELKAQQKPVKSQSEVDAD